MVGKESQYRSSSKARSCFGAVSLVIETPFLKILENTRTFKPRAFDADQKKRNERGSEK